MINYSNQENMEYFSCLASTVTNDAVRVYTREMISRSAMTKAAFNRQTLFTKKFDLHFRRKLAKYYIWSKHLP